MSRYKARSSAAPLKSAIEDYVNHGTPVGSFLRAVLCNDLCEAFCLADHRNQRAMRDYAALLIDIPLACWGSPERVEKWIQCGGLEGLTRKQGRFAIDTKPRIVDSVYRGYLSQEND